MKKVATILFLVFAIPFLTKAQGELNTAIEFFIVKNESTKSAVVTSVFNVKMMDGKSLTSLNIDVKAKLIASLKLSNVIKDGQDALWISTSQAVTAGGEFFNDEAEAIAYAEKLKGDLKKKGFSITEYPFKYE
jgi:hypothetical protein